jgi:hypothetical protein
MSNVDDVTNAIANTTEEVSTSESVEEVVDTTEDVTEEVVDTATEEIDEGLFTFTNIFLVILGLLLVAAPGLIGYTKIMGDIGVVTPYIISFLMIILMMIIVVFSRSAHAVKLRKAKGITDVSQFSEMMESYSWNMFNIHAGNEKLFNITLERCKEKYEKDILNESACNAKFPPPEQGVCPETTAATMVYEYPEDADEDLKSIISGVNDRLMDKSANSCGEANTKTFFTTVLMRLNGAATMDDARTLMENLYDTDNFPEHINLLLKYIEGEKDGLKIVDRTRLAVVYNSVTNLSLDECYKIFGMNKR